MEMSVGTGVFVATEASAIAPEQASRFASQDDFQEVSAR